MYRSNSDRNYGGGSRDDRDRGSRDSRDSRDSRSGGGYSSHYSGGVYTGSGFSGGGMSDGKRSYDDIVLKKPTWSSETLRPFEKDFYRETSQARQRSQREIDDFLKKNSVTFKTDKFVRPVLDFSDLAIPDAVLSQIKKANYEKPSPIQAACWPTLISGSNIVGVAQTGSGKTLGFMLPILIHIHNNHRYVKSFGREDPPGPIALVLAPTRELAQQIQKVADDFGSALGVRNAVLYGGAARGPQIGQIRRGPEICIATPGRLLDLLKEGQISLAKCTFLVLDEADRMLDMGFEPQIRKVIEQIRPDRQTAMFSATWPKEVRRLAEDFLSKYSQVTIGASELTANPNIKQIIEVCENYNKETRLKEILKEIMNHRESKAIIFAETKRRVDQFYEYIRDLGYFCLSIHGDKKQSEREHVLREFKNKSRSILVATDVAARGIDIADINYVINIDYPNQSEDYIHRIGRTARSGKTGTSFTFVTRENGRHLSKLIEILRAANQPVSQALLDLYDRVGRGFGGGYGSRFGGRGGSRNFGDGSGGSYGGAQKRSYAESNDYGSGGRRDSWAGDADRAKRQRWDDPSPRQAYGPYPLGRANNSTSPQSSSSKATPEMPTTPEFPSTLTAPIYVPALDDQAW